MEDDATPALPALVGTFVNDLQLPSGGHVVLRDPLELRAKDRRAVQEAIKDPDRRVGSALDLMDGTICMLVESWDIPYLGGAATPIPRADPDILGELRIPDKVALEKAIDPAMKILFPGESKPEDAATPGTPTRPASA